MKTLLSSSFAVLLALSLLTGCSRKPTLVGKWQGQAGPIEFTKDKKMLIHLGAVTANGTYSVVDDSHVKMELDMGGGKTSDVSTYTVDRNTLTIDDGKMKQELKRVD